MTNVLVWKKAEKRERKRLAAEAKAKAKAKKSGGRSGPVVTVTIKNRTKRKYIVNIFGMDQFGVKLKDAGKKLSKKYACSATVSKNNMGQKEVVMSGDIGYDVANVIHKLFPNIPEAAIVVDKKLKKAKKKTGNWTCKLHSMLAQLCGTLAASKHMH